MRANPEQQTVAALFVEKGGNYYDLPGVDPWDEERDAMRYPGPHPVVAHPPCERWGRYWGGGPMLHGTSRQKVLGDDGGCFASALASVRRWGGVLEHPEASHAFKAHGLLAPARRIGWQTAGDMKGWVCCVSQANYGHRSRKLTWLYAVTENLPELDWTIPVTPMRLEDGFHSKEERSAFRSNRTLSPEMMKRKAVWLDMVEKRSGQKAFRRLGKSERAATPPPFRDMLLDLARGARVSRQRAG